MEFSVYPYKNLVEMQGPVRVKAVPRTVLSDRLREMRTEPVPTKATRPVCDVDTALMDQIFDAAQRKREVDAHLYSKADDLGRSLDVPE